MWCFTVRTSFLWLFPHQNFLCLGPFQSQNLLFVAFFCPRPSCFTVLFRIVTSSVFVLCFFPQNHNFLVVLNLRPMSSYRLEVQVISSVGEGPSAVKVFHTPSVSSTRHHSKLLTGFNLLLGLFYMFDPQSVRKYKSVLIKFSFLPGSKLHQHSVHQKHSSEKH